MNMIHGTLVVDPAESSAGQASGPARPAPVPTERAQAPVGPGAAEAEAGQAAERAAEIKDLTRRVLIGAALTAPALFAVMAQELLSTRSPPRSSPTPASAA